MSQRLNSKESIHRVVDFGGLDGIGNVCAEKKNKISLVIILESSTGKVGSSLILMEHRRERFKNITGTLRPHLTQYAAVVVSLTGLLNVPMAEWREEGE